MSDKTPEVGDIWELHGIKDRILNVDDITIRLCYYDVYNKKIRTVNYITKDYLKYAKYIGKSKHSLNDLFEI